MQSGVVTGHDHGLLRHFQGPSVLGTGGMGVADHIGTQPRQVDGLTFQRTPGVQPRQQQQVLDEVGHPFRFRLHPAHRMGDIRGHLGPLALRQFGIAADRGQRCAKFVAGIGDELAHPASLACRVDSAAEMVEHPVHRKTQPADLGVRVGVDLGHPHGQGDLAAVEGRSATAPAVAATRSSGARARRITQMPASAATASARAVTTAKIRATRARVWCSAHAQPDDQGVARPASRAAMTR